MDWLVISAGLVLGLFGVGIILLGIRSDDENVVVDFAIGILFIVVGVRLIGEVTWLLQ